MLVSRCFGSNTVFSRITGEGLLKKTSKYHTLQNATDRIHLCKSAAANTFLQRRDCFWEPSDKGSLRYEKRFRDKLYDMPINERAKLGWKVLKDETKLWMKENRKILEDDHHKIYEQGDIDYLFNFRTQEGLDQWKVSCDSDWDEGFTKAELVPSPSGYGLFRGFLDTTLPRDGRIVRAGWAHMCCQEARKSFYRHDFWDWTQFTHMVLRVRGDGRTYHLRLHTKGQLDLFFLDGNSFYLYTHGGPYWQLVRIPLSRFFFAYKGRIQEDQTRVRDGVTQVSISLMDGYKGPFSLEIDYLGMMTEPYSYRHLEYESYRFPHIKFLDKY